MRDVIWNIIEKMLESDDPRAPEVLEKALALYAKTMGVENATDR